MMSQVESKTLAFACLLLIASNVAAQTSDSKTSTVEAGVVTADTSSIVTESPTEINIWNGATCDMDVCLAMSLYQNKFYVYMFTYVPIVSIQFAIMLDDTPIQVAPVDIEGATTIGGNSMVYVEEPSELIVTAVLPDMPPIQPMDPSNAFPLLGVYEHLGGDGNGNCEEGSDQISLDLMVDCAEARSFNLVKVQATQEIDEQKEFLSDSSVKYGQVGPSRNDPVCCCFQNWEIGQYGPADLTYGECLLVANNGSNDVFTGETTGLYPTCPIFAEGTCAENYYEYVYACCPSSTYGR